MAQSEKSKNLTDKFKQLEELSKYFEKEEIDIDEAIKKYEEGVKLAAEIKEQLKTYEVKIDEIKKKYEEKVGDEDNDVSNESLPF